MKAFVRFGLPILILASLALEVHAQGPVTTSARVPAIAFVKATRDTLFLKRADSAVKVILHTSPDFKISKLAILDVTPDGSRYLLAGSFDYTNPFTGQPANYTGLISYPVGLDLSSANINTILATVKFVKAYTSTGGFFRPTGKISSDGKSWFAIMTSGSPYLFPSVIMYHGSMDKSEIDPGAVIDTVKAVPSSPPEINDYHMSNIAISDDNRHAVAVLTNQISTLTDDGYLFLHWNLDAVGSSALTVRGPVQITGGLTNTEDSLFGLTVKIDDGTFAEVAIMNKSNGSLEFKRWRYSGSGNVVLEDGGYSIGRHGGIPDDEYFFAGENRGPYKENQGNFRMLGLAGDMAFNRAGDSVVFITHPQDDHNSVTERNQKTRIYVYNGSSAKEIYNDLEAQELQPVFASDVAYTKHYPGIAWSGSHAGSFGSHDTMTTTTLQFSVKDTSAVAAVRDSISITGPDSAEFKLVSGGSTIIQPGATVTLSIAWTPVGTAGPRNATLTIVGYNGLNGPVTITQDLSGTATVKKPTGGGGVKEDPALAAAIEVQPNPFSASTSIRLTAPDAGTMALIVHDALGRVVFTSDARKVQAGSIESFEFDAKSLALPNGVYYVTAFLGDRQASRQVVFVK
jgi:hypothetical protein